MSSSPAANGKIHRDIVVIGASAGGVEALKTILSSLPPEFRAAVLVTLHTSSHGPNLLAPILDRASPLRVRFATDGDRVRCGEVYVAISDHHLIVQDGRIVLGRGPRENGFRPAVDVMFRAAAVAYGPRVIGIVLTGSLDDGTAGFMAIKQRGGATIAQDPAEAIFPSMPQSTIDHRLADHVSRLEAMPALLRHLTSEPLIVAPMPEVPIEMQMEVDMAGGGMGGHPEQTIGKPSNFGCPDCGGPLRAITDAREGARFRCHVGHAWSDKSLSDVQRTKIDEAIWTAIRWLDEEEMLSAYGAERARRKGKVRVSKLFEERAEKARKRGDRLRALLREADPLPEEDLVPAEEPRSAGAAGD